MPESLPVTTWNPRRPSAEVEAFCERPAFSPAAEKTAHDVLAAVKRQGDKAVLKYARTFDKLDSSITTLRVSKAEIEVAKSQVDAAFKKAARESNRRIARFSKAGMRKDWAMKTPGGGSVGERFEPLQRVGAYIPGGEAPLVSTALMTVSLARVAGVPEIVACTPCAPDGSVNPTILYALDLAGATEIYRVGGIQAIAAMAYGTASISPVRKIVGPGGPYVTAAKRLVYGVVDLDLVAGPSEVAILADSTARAKVVAIDLLAQLEHGTGHEKSLLVTTSKRLAAQVARQVFVEAGKLTRSAFLRKGIPKNLMIVVVPDIDAGVALCNRFAAEHLEVLVRKPRRVLGGIRSAGAIFLGPWTPESAGDFVAGPSHVLPTGGTAAVFSGLTVDSFRRRASVIEFRRKDLEETLSVIEAFGRVEHLDAHARSAQVRFES